MERYDVLAIGGGTAGLVTAAGAAGLGARAALVERARLGGECLWTGCVPSKALLAAARMARDARRAPLFGVDVGQVSVDFARVVEHVREVQARIAPHDSAERFRGLGVEVVEGAARFLDGGTVDVDGRRLSARHIVVATGSRPALPAIPGLDSTPFLTNETIFALERAPASLLVLGGGPIGLELGQALALLGCVVTVVEEAPELMPGEDPELVALLRAGLEVDGLRIVTGAHVGRISGDARAVALETDGARLEAEQLLVACGRTPSVAGLELDAAGVEATADGIVVDRRLRTTAGGIWAAGDVVGPLRFTHVADYQARLVLRNALFPFSTAADYSAVPRVVYTEPELARVGLTEAEARERHGDGVRVWRRPFDDADRAIVERRTEGMVKLVADRRGRLLGGHILGQGASSLIAELTLALRHGLSLGQIAATMHAYPTFPEVVKQAAELQQRARLRGASAWLVRRLVRR